MELNQETRARLSKLINRIADNVDDLRSLAISILSDTTEETPLIDLGLDTDETPVAEPVAEVEPKPVQNIAPMRRSYCEMLRPKRMSRRAKEGKIATYELASTMKAEFGGIDSRKIIAVCRRHGITVYQHGHASYIHYTLADMVARYLRAENS